MATESSSKSRPGISTFKGQDRALRAGRLGTGGLLLSVLAATAPLMVVAGVMPTTFGVMGIVGQPLLFVILGVVLALFSLGYAEMSRHVDLNFLAHAKFCEGRGAEAAALFHRIGPHATPAPWSYPDRDPHQAFRAARDSALGTA